jgi:hypothetical protein
MFSNVLVGVDERPRSADGDVAEADPATSAVATT